MSSHERLAEGIYLAPEHRRGGYARELVGAIEEWAVESGCSELASDAAIDNHASHAFHRAIGLVETERVVYFRKPLDERLHGVASDGVGVF